MIDFSPVIKAGLKQREFAALVGVSRATVNKWMRGGAPHHLVLAKVLDVLLGLDAAVKKGTLPLQTSAPRMDRYSLIQQAVQG